MGACRHRQNPRSDEIIREKATSDGHEDPVKSRHKAIDLARKALEVGENDPRILANAATALALFGEDIGAIIGLVDRALALNPSYARS